MTSDLQQLRQHLDRGRLTISRLDDGSGVVLDVERERLFTLNATGLGIIQAAADGAADETAVVEALVARFEVSEADAQQDVQTFLARLLRAL